MGFEWKKPLTEKEKNKIRMGIEKDEKKENKRIGFFGEESRGFNQMDNPKLNRSLLEKDHPEYSDKE